MTPFQMTRLGMIMEPRDGEADEAEGVLNPAAARGPDGNLYLFPRLVGKGNFSRVGIAKVVFDADGNPTGVERMGIALEPQADYELRPGGGGGCEDPRVNYVDPLGHYVMTYTALGPNGPRIAVARSEDLITWERIGLARFDPYKDIAMDGIDDKDSSVFGSYADDPSGKSSLALLHRPLFRGTRPEEMVEPSIPAPTSPDLESIWISYWQTDSENRLPRPGHFVSHRRLARPEAPWESLKIGGGAPPILCRHGWLLVYHGVHEMEGSTSEHRKVSYCAGVMILDKAQPHRILYRSPTPVLTPEAPGETHGVVDNVVFPTGVDRRDDIGQPDRFDIYYGMADFKIGVATLTVPEILEGLG